MDSKIVFVLFLLYFLLFPVCCYSQGVCTTFITEDSRSDSAIRIKDDAVVTTDITSILDVVKQSFTRKELKGFERSNAVIEFSPYVDSEGRIKTISWVAINEDSSVMSRLSSNSIFKLIENLKSSVSYRLPDSVVKYNCLYNGFYQLIEFSKASVSSTIDNRGFVFWSGGGVICISTPTKSLFDNYSFSYNDEKWLAMLGDEVYPLHIKCDAICDSSSLGIALSRAFSKRQLSVLSERNAQIEAKAVIDDEGNIAGISQICMRGPSDILGILNTKPLEDIRVILQNAIRFNDHGQMKYLEAKHYGYKVIEISFPNKKPEIKII